MGRPDGRPAEKVEMTGKTRTARVILVDDSSLHREMAADALLGQARLECCEDGEAALAALRRESADLVVSDLNMPGLSGMDLLERVRAEFPGTDFVVLTGNASVESAITALRMGAADYLRKPIQAPELSLVVERTLARQRLLDENSRLQNAVRTMEACRVLAPCLDPAEVYAMALDLLMRCLSRRRGLALFRRSSLALSDGLVVRGFDASEEARLHRLLVDEKQIDFESSRKVEIATRSPIHPALHEAGVDAKGLLSVPVRGEENEAGMLWLFEQGRPFEESDLEQARIVAGHAQLSLRNAERYDHARESAFIDDVTELYNARYLFDAVDHEIRRAERNGTELCVLFLDLDRFKLVNDRFGHLVGSRALRQLGSVLLDCVRQVDTLARYGGDEFTIVLADTTHDTAMLVAERIRSTVESARFEAARGEAMHLTVSIGVSAYPAHGQDREVLLDLADKAMYRAKSIGRNRVCSASEL